MLCYLKLSKKPNQFRTFTELTIEEFDKLYKEVKSKYKSSEIKRLGRKERIKAIGQGRKFKLDLINRLMMLLVYYRLYTTFCLTGFLFNIDQSTVYRDIKYLEPLVKRCIPLPKKVPKKAERIGNIQELQKYFSNMKAFVDATEQEIPRPKNKRRRKNYYSEKKKKHTVKTQILVSPVR